MRIMLAVIALLAMMATSFPVMAQLPSNLPPPPPTQQPRCVNCGGGGGGGGGAPRVDDHTIRDHNREAKRLMKLPYTEDAAAGWLALAQQGISASDWFNYAVWENHLGHYEEAIRIYSWLTTNCWDDASICTDSARNARANQQLLDQRNAQARQNAANAEYNANITEFHRIDGGPDSAQSIIDWRNLAQRTGWAIAYFNYAAALGRANRPDEAADAYGRVCSGGGPPANSFTDLCAEANKRVKSCKVGAARAVLETLRNQRANLYWTRDRIDEEETRINKVAADNEQLRIAYNKMLDEYNAHQTSEGYDKLMEFHRIYLEQVQRVTDWTVAWAAKKKQNNADLNQNEADQKAQEEKIERLEQ